MATLKVYRTPIGFHDAYVAAPSQKAALAAWGTTRNLFAQGSAELVTDPALSREPLASPGTVIKRSRGTAAEQMAALPPSLPSEKPAGAPPKTGKPKKPVPRPDRHPLERAEQALAGLQDKQRSKRQAVEEQIAVAKAELAKLERDHAAQAATAQGKLDLVAQSYKTAMERWRELP